MSHIISLAWILMTLDVCITVTVHLYTELIVSFMCSTILMLSIDGRSLYTVALIIITSFFLLQQLFVIFMISLVIMETVFLKVTSVTRVMTVEIAVMKKDVVCDGKSWNFFQYSKQSPRHLHWAYRIIWHVLLDALHLPLLVSWTEEKHLAIIHLNNLIVGSQHRVTR